MGLKDWEISDEQNSSSYDVLYHKKNTYGNSKQEIGIGTDMDNEWVVDFFNAPNMKLELTSRKCRSKSDAMKIAKDYMKRN